MSSSNNDPSAATSGTPGAASFKKTPLCQEHIQLGAKMVEFAGWYMPIQYKGLREEHNCVRTQVGLFDVSHMGEVFVKGAKALATLEHLTTNDVNKLNPGEAQYSLLPNPQGGLVDDIIIYCIEKGTNYLVCVNAANKDKDFQWMLKNNLGADITDESSMWSQIAIQGPKGLELAQRIFPALPTKSFTFKVDQFKGSKVIIALTGYTGESGCEVFIENAGAAALWKTLLEKGADLGVQAIGLGARDTLRTEMKYSLYGHEIDDTTNPYEAGLGWVVKPAGKDFIGKGPILALKEKGLQRSLVGFRMVDKGIPRQGYSLFSFDNKEIGKVTSGTHSPTLDEPIGIGYVTVENAKIGTEILVDIRGRKVKAKVVKTPFIEK